MNVAGWATMAGAAWLVGVLSCLALARAAGRAERAAEQWRHQDRDAILDDLFPKGTRR